jgi:sugar/nucleoside kinase (ribokinase family)
VTPRRILVIGDVMLDVVVKPMTEVAPTSDTPARVRLSRGGSAANMSVALALAGHHVTFLGASGDDVAAQMFEQSLLEVGVRAALERVEAPTGVVVALVGDDAQRAMLTDRGANPMLTMDYVLAQLERPFDHLHVSGYTFLDPTTRHVGMAALSRAVALRRPTSVDVCSVGPLAGVTPQVFKEAIKGTSTLFANEEEALLLSGASDVLAAMDILSKDYVEIVVTRGNHGARAQMGGNAFEVPSLSYVVFDTTGAGDAATGTYLALRLKGSSMIDSLYGAMRASSEVVRGLGSRGQS